MNATLVLVKPDGTMREVPIKGERVVIGREKKCTVRIPVPSVSREHCEVRFADGRVLLQDMGSSNGTYVNRRRVEQGELKAGDLVAIGPAVFVVTVNGQPASIDAAASYREGAGPKPVTAKAAGAKARPSAPAGAKPKPALDDEPDISGDDSEDSSVVDFNFDFLDESDEEKKQPKL
ncbi:MAG: FHA domain-containing protein [Phycisphaerales bacterium]